MEGITPKGTTKVIFIKPDPNKHIPMSSRVAKLEKSYAAFLRLSREQQRHVLEDVIANNQDEFPKSPS
jgi:hypothetical protein